MYFSTYEQVTNSDYRCYLMTEFFDLYFSNLLIGWIDFLEADKVSYAFYSSCFMIRLFLSLLISRLS